MEEGYIFWLQLCETAAKGGVTVVHNETGIINTYAFKGRDWVSYDSSTVIKAKVRLSFFHSTKYPTSKFFFQMDFLMEQNLAGAFFMYLSDDDFDGRACKCGKFHLLRTMNEALRGDGSCAPPLCP